jgi:hypothetical protein
MGLHIEITGELSPGEWKGVKALAMIALGEISLDALTVASVRPCANIHGIGPDTAASVAPVATPEPPAPIADTPPPPPTVDTPPPPPPTSASEALLAATASAVTLTPPPHGVEVDVNGMPWDARIHSAERTKNKDNTWRNKRGTDKSLIAAVEAELKQAMSAPPAGAVLDPSAAFGGVPVPPATVVPPTPSPAVPVAETTPVPPPPAAEPSAAMNEFARVMRVVVAKQAAGTLTTELTTQVAQQLGVASVRDLVHRPDLIPAFEAMLP